MYGKIEEFMDINAEQMFKLLEIAEERRTELSEMDKLKSEQKRLKQAPNSMQEALDQLKSENAAGFSLKNPNSKQNKSNNLLHFEKELSPNHTASSTPYSLCLGRLSQNPSSNTQKALSTIHSINSYTSTKRSIEGGFMEFGTKC